MPSFGPLETVGKPALSPIGLGKSNAGHDETLWRVFRKPMVSPWHILTPEYPPQLGGVADYSFLVARGLVCEGDEVHVWGPAGIDTQSQHARLAIHDELGRFRLVDLRRTGRMLNRFPKPRRLLVQWVPHGFGMRSMNVPFCVWLWNRSVFHGDSVDIMFHEPYLPFAGSWRQFLAALVHRLMTVILLKTAHQTWVTIPAWEARLRPYALGRKMAFRWLPVPNNIPVDANPEAEARIRELYCQGRPLLLGHFGTHVRNVTSILEQVLPGLLRQREGTSFLLMGGGSREFRDKLAALAPDLADRIHATGRLNSTDLSHHLSACDLMLQPYPDGMSTRRSSAMAALAHGCPTVTTSGDLSEDFWATSGGVGIAPVEDTRAYVREINLLLDDKSARAALGERAKALYQSRFDLRHIIVALRQAPSNASTCAS